MKADWRNQRGPRCWAKPWLSKTVFLCFLIASASPALASLTNPTNSVEAGIQRAILRGDAQELRTLLGQAGELSANDSAIAQRALASMERVAVQDAKALAERYGVDWGNKVQHALKTKADGPVKQALFRQFGSAEAIFARLDRAVAELRNVPAGSFVRKVVVDGLDVVVRCIGRDGGAMISTIEKW